MPHCGRTGRRSVALQSALWAMLPAALAVIATLGTGAASAAGLGGLTAANLTAGTVAAPAGAPTVLAWENFTATSGTNIVGTTTDGGAATWTSNPSGGFWQVNADQARSSTSDSSLVIDPGTFNVTTVATIARNGATSFDAGLTIGRNSSGSQFLSCEWSSAKNGSMEIWKYDSGWTLLASVTKLSPKRAGGPPESIQLACSTTATDISASIDGTVVVTAALTSSEQIMFKNTAHQLTGPYQYLSSGLTWDDLHVDLP